MRTYTHLLQSWIDANPSVKAWAAKVSRRRNNTGEVYSSHLWKYWKESLHQRFNSIDHWVQQTKKQLKDEDIQVSRIWARTLEDFVAGSSLRKASRFVLVQAVKSFLKESVDLPEYKFNYESEGMPEEYEYPPLTADELKILVNKASTRDKAVILTQISTGFGIGELVRFTREWNRYEKPIREKQVPIRVEMRRPKTKVRYWSLLWHDAVDSLNALLLERTGETGEASPKLLFVNQYDKPVSEHDIQESVRRCADASGLEPNRPGVRIYRIRPHALRHYFKTTCTNSEVNEKVSEFLLGHTVDKLGYDEFMETKKGEELIRSQMLKAVPSLNVLTGRGKVEQGEPYIEQLKKAAVMFGVTPQSLVDEVLAQTIRSTPFLDRVRERIRSGEYQGEGVEEEMLENVPRQLAEDILAEMTREELQPAVIAWAKARNAPTPGKKPIQKVIPEQELQRYLDDGWSFRSVINHTSVLVERTVENS